MDAQCHRVVLAARAQLKRLNERTPEETEAARRADKATHQELKKLSREGENAKCADCGALYPGWAALPHGVFLCMNCAQVHRHLGRHISQVKAVNTGTYLWYPDELSVMRTVGNARANAISLGKAPRDLPRPHDKSSRDEVLRFARAKYERKEWHLSEPPTTEPQTRALAATANTPPSSGKVTRAQDRDLLLSFEDAPPSPSRPTCPSSPATPAPHGRGSLVQGILSLYGPPPAATCTGGASLLPKQPQTLGFPPTSGRSTCAQQCHYPPAVVAFSPVPVAPAAALGTSGTDFFASYGL
uniref:Arf-GAP domain-containing protein n=1 Tax=Rhizochromulina marina TaxID=1034831 RepID=A0A7S2S1I9_9STRA|mmetsp:Transcript_23829/g.69797  ORF Transcript_23829/g.69797 Transcript_23829/m.69797 type:complete len:299 (+) Transcript_23829:102-998(+)